MCGEVRQYCTLVGIMTAIVLLTVCPGSSSFMESSTFSGFWLSPPSSIAMTNGWSGRWSIEVASACDPLRLIALPAGGELLGSCKEYNIYCVWCDKNRHYCTPVGIQTGLDWRKHGSLIWSFQRLLLLSELKWVIWWNYYSKSSHKNQVSIMKSRLNWKKV